MQSCPLCGAETQQRTSNKGVVFVGCTRYPACKLYGTPETVNALVHAHSERDAAVERDKESQRAKARLVDKVLSYRGENVDELCPVPLRVGEYIGDVAELAIRRSRLKQERSRDGDSH